MLWIYKYVYNSIAIAAFQIKFWLRLGAET